MRITQMLNLLSLVLLGQVSAFQGPQRAHPITFSVPQESSVRSPTRLFSTQTYRVDVNEQSTRNPNGFLEWASYYGVSPENFRLDPSSNNWRGVTTQAAAAGSRALMVPANLRITSQAAREQDFADVQRDVARLIGDAKHYDGDSEIPLSCHFYLFMKVLQEYDRGDQSPYVSWLDALPRKFSTAMTFSDFEMDCLPPFVKFLANKDRFNYSLFIQSLQQMNTPTISDSTKYNEEATKWAFNVVFTRARASFGEAEIIPMSDMLNHNAKPNVMVQYDDEGNVHMVLQRDMQAGEELYKCYGQPTNPSRYFATFGFFDASPPATYCKLFPGLETTTELRNLGFGYDRMVFYVENGEIAPEVWDVTLYLLLANIDTNAQQQFYQAHMQGDQNSKGQIHRHFMAQTVQALYDHVEETLQELEECQETMDEGGMGLRHKSLPMIRRHNDFVRQTFTKVKKNLQAMR